MIKVEKNGMSTKVELRGEGVILMMEMESAIRGYRQTLVDRLYDGDEAQANEAVKRLVNRALMSEKEAVADFAAELKERFHISISRQDEEGHREK